MITSECEQVEQVRQSTYKVTMWRFPESSAVERKYILHICVCVCVRVCSLAYPACNFYAPCRDVICGPSGSAMLLDIILQRTRFLKKGC